MDGMGVDYEVNLVRLGGKSVYLKHCQKIKSYVRENPDKTEIDIANETGIPFYIIRMAIQDGTLEYVKGKGYVVGEDKTSDDTDELLKQLEKTAANFRNSQKLGTNSSATTNSSSKLVADLRLKSGNSRNQSGDER